MDYLTSVLRSLIFVAVTAIALSNLAVADYQKTQLNFEHGGNQLEGMLIKPKRLKGPTPVLLFIDGDGDAPYDGYGYSEHVWRSLADVGIASFSWNKPGVGGSTGNWLHQSLEERADEVIAAIEMLKLREDILEHKIGLIGWSQAGWVMPIVASKSDYPDFMIVVSGAINWMDQGHYMRTVRMMREGATQLEIDAAKVASLSTAERHFSMSYEEYAVQVSTGGDDPMSRDRFRFVQLNWRSDARHHLKDIDCPVLAIFGGQDVNVDTVESAKIYRQEFGKAGNHDLTIQLFPDAQHGILKGRHFSAQKPGLWFLTKLAFFGADAFADGYLDLIASWAKEQTVP